MTLYPVIRGLLRPLFRLLFRFDAPLFRFEGPAVVVANHFSLIDPVPLGLALEPSLDFMAKAEIFRVPVLGAFFRSCGVFPVRRGGGGRPAIETAIQRAKSGRVIAMFPEGTRSRDGHLQAPKPGAALIALGAGVPIVPVAISGTYEVLPRGKWFPRFFRRIKVRVGAPIDVAPYREMPDGAARLTERFMEEISARLSDLR